MQFVARIPADFSLDATTAGRNTGRLVKEQEQRQRQRIKVPARHEIIHTC